MLTKALTLASRVLYTPRLGSRWAGPLSRNAIWRLPTAHIDKAGALVIPGLGAAIPAPNDIGMATLRAIRLAVDLHERGGATWTFEEHAALLQFEGISVRAYNTADINMLHEIFVERLYAFQLPGEFLVLDVGANTGASMLYFAKHYTAEVRGFELVPSTAALARQNLELNPALNARITFNDYGLGDADREIDLACDPALRPSNSVFAPAKSETATVETVFVKDAVPVVSDAIDDLAERKLILKLDAEGAEYGILRRLAQTDLISRIDLLLLEWHRIEGEDPETIRTLLTQAGFTWFEREHPHAPVGFITAFKR